MNYNIGLGENPPHGAATASLPQSMAIYSQFVKHLSAQPHPTLKVYMDRLGRAEGEL
jgi:hypothetical protein